MMIDMAATENDRIAGRRQSPLPCRTPFAAPNFAGRDGGRRSPAATSVCRVGQGPHGGPPAHHRADPRWAGARLGSLIPPYMRSNMPIRPSASRGELAFLLRLAFSFRQSPVAKRRLRRRRHKLVVELKVVEIPNQQVAKHLGFDWAQMTSDGLKHTSLDSIARSGSVAADGFSGFSGSPPPKRFGPRAGRADHRHVGRTGPASFATPGHAIRHRSPSCSPNGRVRLEIPH